jgi:hypothetical protein
MLKRLLLPLLLFSCSEQSTVKVPAQSQNYMPTRKVGEQYYCYDCADADSSWTNRVFLTLLSNRQFEIILDHFDNSTKQYVETKHYQGQYDRSDSTLTLFLEKGDTSWYKLSSTRVLSSGTTGSKDQQILTYEFQKSSPRYQLQGCSFFLLDQNNRLSTGE